MAIEIRLADVGNAWGFLTNSISAVFLWITPDAVQPFHDGKTPEDHVISGLMCCIFYCQSVSFDVLQAGFSSLKIYF